MLASPASFALPDHRLPELSRLSNPWLIRQLPEVMLRVGPFDLALWQWLALPLLFVGAVVLSRVLVWCALLVLRPLARHTPWKWDDLLLERLQGPARLMLAVELIGWALPLVYPSMGPGMGSGTGPARTVDTLLRIGLLGGIIWSLWRTIDVMVGLVRASPWMQARPAALGVIPLGHRLADVTLVIAAVVMSLQELGYQVTSLIAGLGIGGLAVALAAQKTVEHLFGGVMLSIDQPMRVGDAVKIGDIVGTVEEIGLRSTRIRTADRTLVTIPNGKLADMNIETYAVRDRLRLNFHLLLTYDTQVDRITGILDAVERLLRERPKIWPDNVQVRLSALGPSSLDIEVLCWFQTVDWDEFLKIRQEVLLGVLRIVEAQGAQVALPATQVQWVKACPSCAGGRPSG